MKILIIFIIVIFYTGCQNDKNKEINERMNDVVATPKINENETRILCDKILKDGDTISYNNLSYIFFLNNRSEELLYYSFFMANKYNYSDAYYDVYSIFTDIEKPEALDLYSKKIATYYLLLAYEHGHIEANEILVSKYGKKENYPKSSDIFCSTKKSIK